MSSNEACLLGVVNCGAEQCHPNTGSKGESWQDLMTGWSRRGLGSGAAHGTAERATLASAGIGMHDGCRQAPLAGLLLSAVGLLS